VAQPLLDPRQVNALDFLQRIVPPGSHYVVGWAESEDRFKQKVFTAPDEAVKFSQQKSFQRKNVYYAMASYKQGYHEAPDGKMVLRTMENVAELRALWLDIDVGEKKGYQSKDAALTDLRRFLMDTNVPGPSYVVNSGGGIHAYWTLDAPVDTAAWIRLAEGLKAACKAKGFKADPSCTSNPNRVLRLPATYNYKKPDSPVEVTVLLARKDNYTYSQLEAALNHWVDPLPVVPPYIAVDAVTPNNDLSDGLNQVRQPRYMGNIVQRCRVMQHIAATRGADCEEPLWVAVLQLVKCCDDAQDWIHPLSDGHQGYDHRATEYKYQQRVSNSFGGTLCSTFEQYLPDKCGDCPHRGRIKSPLRIGGENYEDPFGLPRGYKVIGEITERWVRVDENDGEWVGFLPYAPLSLDEYAGEGGETSYVIRVRRHGKVVAAVVPGAYMNSPNDLRKTFGTYGLAIVNSKAAEMVAGMIYSWREKLREAKIEASYNVTHLGWASNKQFITGNSRYHKSEKPIPHKPNPTSQQVTLWRNFMAQGELDVWKTVANGVISQNEPAICALIATGFAAPLVKLSGTGGCVISAVSKASGVGKSTAISIAQGIWGHPTSISSLDDTETATVMRLEFLNSLPAYWDEIRGQKAIQAVTRTVFRVSEGIGKARATRDAKLRRVGTWNTMITTASNTHILAHIGQADLDSDAGLMRVFEFDVITDHTGMTPPSVDLLNNNYGLAGEAYAEFLAANQKQITNDIKLLKAKLTEKYKVLPKERFWLNSVALLLLGAVYANRLGLTQFDTDKLKVFLLATLTSLRSRVGNITADRDCIDLLGDYLRDNFAERLVTNKLPTKGGNARATVDVTHPPQRGVPIYQIGYEDHTALVPRKHFNEWLHRRDYSSSVVQELIDRTFVKETRATVGARTSYSQTRTNCLKIDLSADVNLYEMIDTR